MPRFFVRPDLFAKHIFRKVNEQGFVVRQDVGLNLIIKSIKRVGILTQNLARVPQVREGEPIAA